MQNSKLTGLLRTLSPKEINRFGDFVHSPFFNKLSNVTRLYDELKKFYPEFSQEGAAKEAIFTKLYPREKYHDGKMRNLSSDLMELLMKFLAQTSFMADDTGFSKNLLNGLRKRKQDFHFEKEYERITNHIEHTTDRDENYFERKLVLEKEYLKYIDERKSDFKKIDENQQQIGDLLVRFFAISIMKIYTFMMNQNLTLFRHEYNLSFLNELLAHMSAHAEEYKNEPYIIAFYRTLELLLKKDEASYFRLKESMNEYFDKLSGFASKNIYTIMANYCQHRIYNGDFSYEREVFELDKETLVKKVYDEEFLQHNRFRNILIHAVNLREFEWAENFIAEYKPKLLREFRDSSANWGYAYFYFKKGEYGKSLKLLLKVQTEDLSFKLYIKSLQMMIYFETGETEALLSLTDTFKHTLSKSKQLAAVFRDFFLNFGRFTEKLARIRENFNGEELHYLKEEIKNLNNIANKAWLLEKAEEMENRE